MTILLETYTLDIYGSLVEGAWSGSKEIRFGAGSQGTATAPSRATLRFSLQDAETGEKVAGSAIERVVDPGVQERCASETEVAVAKISETYDGLQLSLEKRGLGSWVQLPNRNASPV